MECLTWKPEELIAVASALLKDDKKNNEKIFERKESLNDEFYTFIRVLSNEYEYRYQKEFSYMSENFANGLHFVSKRNLEYLVFELVYGFIKPEEIRNKVKEERERIFDPSITFDEAIKKQNNGMMETLSFYSIMGVLAMKISDGEIDIHDFKIDKNLRKYLKEIMSHDKFMHEEQRKKIEEVRNEN